MDDVDKLLQLIADAPISTQGDVYAFARAKKHEEDAGGFDISANDEYGTYHVAEFSCGGRKDDGTYWTNPEKNRMAMIAVWNAMPGVLAERIMLQGYVKYVGENMEKMAHGWVPVCYEEFVQEAMDALEEKDNPSKTPKKDDGLDNTVFVW